MKITTLIPFACCLVVLGFGCSSEDPATSPESPAGSAGSDAKPSEPATSTSPAQDPQAQPAADDGDDKAEPAPADSASAPAQNPTPADPGTAPAANSGKVDHTTDIRGLCNINSGYPDDKACIPAPAAEEGMQLHVGPSDYTNKEDVAKYILKPGEETSQCWTFKTPNDAEVFYQTAMLSGRSGTHHIINSMFEGDIPEGGFSSCADGSGRSNTTVKQIGSIPGASKPFMMRGHVAPEYAHVGRNVPAHAVIQADMHYYNFTDQDLVREFWLNLYYVEKEAITEVGNQIAGLGGFGWNQNPIPPHTDQVYKYSCPIKGAGHIMNLLGHYHAHGKRFTAFLQRGGAGEPEKVFEMYDYRDPATFEYNSIIQNPTFSEAAAGAVSGQLAVSDGDVLQWECHIVNDSEVALKYVNEVKTGEMCNLWGASVGTEPISCYLR